MRIAWSLAMLGVGLGVLGGRPASGQEREQRQPRGQIMDAIGVAPGMTIGEVGAGSGYLTFHLAARVGERGKVYANDISEASLSEITARAAAEGVGNVEPVRSEDQCHETRFETSGR